MEELLNDPRFAHVPRDPKFRRIPKHERKIKIDKRFQSMFTDKKFTVKYTIDKRGRPVNQNSSENLKKFYELSSGSDDDSEKDDEEEKEESTKDKKKLLLKNVKSQKEIGKKIKSKKVKGKKQEEQNSVASDNDNDDGNKEQGSINGNEESEDSEDSEDSDGSQDQELQAGNEEQLQIVHKGEKKKIKENIKKKLRDLTIDYARGEGILLSDSSSESELSDAEQEEEEIEHNWGELDKEAETTNEETSRLAACNMDWDRIRAVDLMVLFNSFLPPSGLIRSVKIYPSEFGKQRMEEEEIKGPIELTSSKNVAESVSDKEDDDNDDEESKSHMEKIRQYQLNRLKYYYAVITFDSPETANKIYTECDGVEYESTATKLDLRFIPDDMTFEDEPRDVCEKLPELSKYQPRRFTTTALQQVKVRSTWDETDPDRVEVTQKFNSGKIDEITENDINAYLASGTSDESDSEENEEKNEEDDKKSNVDSLEKYRSLLKSIEEKEEDEKKKKMEMELTWDVGVQEKAEKLAKDHMMQKEQMTPFEKYLEKRREKKKVKRDKKNTGNEENDEDQESGSDSGDSIPSDIDMNDPYFAEEIKKNEKLKKNKSKKTQKDHKLPLSDDEKAKAELELLMLDEDDQKDKYHFNMKTIEENEALTKSKKKRLIKKQKIQKESVVEDNFKLDVADSRFSALFTSHHFNIDPTDPHYRNTPGTTALINEQLKRRANKSVEEEESVPLKQARSSKDTLNSDLAALVKTVKKNTKNNIGKNTKNISKRIK